MVKKLSDGKFTFKHMFRSSNSKTQIQAELLEGIAQAERDIENWDVIKKFLVVYLAEVAIPEFKQMKQMKYVGAMFGFSGDELHNASSHKECWGDFYELVKRYNEDQISKSKRM